MLLWDSGLLSAALSLPSLSISPAMLALRFSTWQCRRVSFAMNISLAANIFLLVVKIYAFYASKSKAILASAADSLVDIASQLVIAYAEYQASVLIVSSRFQGIKA